MWAQRTLALTVLAVVWMPLETFPWSWLLLTLSVMFLLPWAWQRSSRDAVRPTAAGATLLVAMLVLSALAGSDRALAAQQLALVAAAATVFFVATRQRPAPSVVIAFALGLAALSLWAAYQVAFGFERLLDAAAEVGGPAGDYLVQRLSSGRAFASLMLPGHLGAVLATALALLAPAAASDWRRWTTPVGVGLCLLGLSLTLSPIALGLAALVSVVLLSRRNPKLMGALLVVFVFAGAVAVVSRPDLGRLEPVSLRLDNWRTALWVWSTSPVAGVGFGSYGQASQTVPFAVGNRPLHAHCLPLELLAELGLFGLLLVGLASRALLRLLRGLWTRHPKLAVALLVIPIHNLVDFSAYTSAVLLLWSLLAGWGWAELVRETAPEPVSERGRAPAMAVAALAVVMAALNATSVTVQSAFARNPDSGLAVAGCLRAHRLAPWRPGPVVDLGLAALDTADLELCTTATKVLAASRWQRPDSATQAALSARLAWACSALPTAAAEAAQAVAAQPHNPRAAAELDAMLRALDESRDVASE